ncbi:MAG: universal stress protein [Gemmatimonadota bacterium]|nr:universal stress protein [Gemmatimonadota bacterium]
MIQLDKILYSTDFGESAGEALQYAAMLASEYGAELHLIHVLSPYNEGEVPPEEGFSRMEESVESCDARLIRNTRQRINRKIERHRRHGLEMFKHIERGLSPYQEIVRVAREQDMDLVVMGTYGRGPVAHFFFGSTAEQVVRLADCPVLTVRHHAPHLGGDFRGIKRILFPTDFSEYSKKALPYAVSFASRYGAEVHVLHVFEQRVHPSFYILDKSTVFDIDDSLKDRALDALDEFVYQELRQEVQFNCEVTSGTPFLEIINYARAREIDLIVIATHGLTGLEHMILGSTTERVVRKAPCPVLSIKDPEHEFVHP